MKVKRAQVRQNFSRKDSYVSAASLLLSNHRIPSLDYSIQQKLTLNPTKDMDQVIGMFRLIVFNVIIFNRDDRAKNFFSQWFEKS